MGTTARSQQCHALFGDRKLIELRIPGGKPGKEGSQALQEYVAAPHTDNITLITLPRLDMATRKSAWVTALQKNGIYIEIPTIDISRLGNWIMARLKKQHQSASRECIEFLTERVEGNLLAAYTPGEFDTTFDFDIVYYFIILFIGCIILQNI